jgi:hypothetical protein
VADATASFPITATRVLPNFGENENHLRHFAGARRRRGVRGFAVLFVAAVGLVPKLARGDETTRLPRWIMASVRQDFAWLDGQHVCSPERQAAGDFACFRSNDTQYLGTPKSGDAASVRGVAVATTRVLVGYQQFVTQHVAVAGLVGVAVRGGGPKPVGTAGHAFLPLHLEAQASVWPWGPPRRAGVARFFALVGGGIGQIDARANVRVREDRTAIAPPSQLDNPEEQTLSAYRKAGTGFADAGVGMACALSRHWVLRAALEGLVSFPAPGLGAALEAGVAFDL